MLPCPMLSSQTSPLPSAPPNFSIPCALSVSAFRPLQDFRRGRALARHPRLRSGGSSDPCLSLTARPAHAMGRPPNATIPFRITSFADPHRLTSIESHLCKKQGRGWGPYPVPLYPSLTHSNARNPFPFNGLLHDPLDTPGGGHAIPEPSEFRVSIFEFRPSSLGTNPSLARLHRCRGELHA